MEINILKYMFPRVRHCITLVIIITVLAFIASWFATAAPAFTGFDPMRLIEHQDMERETLQDIANNSCLFLPHIWMRQWWLRLVSIQRNIEQELKNHTGKKLQEKLEQQAFSYLKQLWT